ncbi:hypothetical protein [Thermoflavimicrobium dichotomicum]|uniref:hypothetical protein n=1 Tax=Thermoflavimicrobium dichotomicum TaxID=46223 RepID=UPI000B85E73A|nr:hypothetical protein [Thermoflavimicrobium dichotomicum]
MEIHHERFVLDGATAVDEVIIANEHNEVMNVKNFIYNLYKWPKGLLGALYEDGTPQKITADTWDSIDKSREAFLAWQLWRQYNESDEANKKRA